MGSLGSFVGGIGPVFLLPTGNADPLLGSGKWGAGVTPVAVFLNGPVVYGALANHIWSFAGKDKASNDTLQGRALNRRVELVRNDK